MAKDDNNELFDSGVLKRHPKLSVLKRDPTAVAIISKMIPDRINGASAFSTRTTLPPNEGLLRRVSDDTTRNVSDATNIFQILPDTELAMQILISSILSPKDMVNVDIGYKCESKELSGEISGPLVEVIRQYFDETYKIKSDLTNMLKEILFTKGSYPLMVMPESSIDDIIHSDNRVSTEAISNFIDKDFGIRKDKISIGILGEPVKKHGDKETISTESYGTLPKSVVNVTVGGLPGKLAGKLTVSDNFESLKTPLVFERSRKERIQNLIGIRSTAFSKSALSKLKQQNGVGLEANKNNKEEITDNELLNALYRHRNYGLKQYIAVKPDKKIKNATRGHPLVMKLPPESVIPVHVPSNPEDHVGYFVLLDQYGNPLKRTREADYYYDLSRNLSKANITSQLLSATRRSMDGNAASQLEEAETVRMYAEIVEKDLVGRLKNGIYGSNVDIARPLDVYRVMLARSLANMNTQILYVPCELVTYMAFDYNDYGVGKSLLENNKILASIRAMLLFSNTMAAIKNSVGKTGLKIELDPEDPDPGATVEKMIHEYARHRQAAYPLGASNPLDLIDFLQNAGIDVQVSGNDGYFQTTLEVEDKSSNKTLVDTELSDYLKRQYFMSIGLSPETVDQSSDVEFATSIVTSNLLLAKRVMLYQDLLTYHLRDFMVKFVSNSSILMSEMVDIVINNKKALTPEQRKKEAEDIVYEFLASFAVHLPRPDSAKLENQIAAFNLYSDALEQAVDAYLNVESFEMEDYSDMSEYLTTIRANVVAHYKREWLRNNNVLPELMELVSVTEDGKPEFNLMEIQGNHMELIGKSIMSLLKKLKRDKAKREKVLAKLEEQALGEGDDTPDDEGGAGGDFGGTSDDTTGGDDFSASNDEGASDEFGGADEVEAEGDTAPQEDKNPESVEETETVEEEETLTESEEPEANPEENK